MIQFEMERLPNGVAFISDETCAAEPAAMRLVLAEPDVWKRAPDRAGWIAVKPD